jgi:hypothetical protein
MIKASSGKLFAPKDIAFLVLNFFENEDGLLEPYPQPEEFLPQYWPVTSIRDNYYSPDIFTTAGGVKIISIFHAILPNNRDCLLLFATDGLYEYNGAFNSYKKVTSFINNFQTDEFYRPQFILVPTGVVIVQPNGRALFYDGYFCDTLGYVSEPSPPSVFGPTSKRAADSLYPNSETPDPAVSDTPEEQNYSATDPTAMVNDGGYALDGLYNFESGLPSNYGFGRLGTVVTPEGVYSAQGKLLPGEYRYKVQFVDQFGNLSPVSAPSMPATFAQQYSWLGTLTTVGPNVVRDVGVPANADHVKKQLLVTGIPKGDRRTLGRILYRSKDLRNSGDSGYYILPGNAAGGAFSFATVPDNSTQMFPDNVPDSWLVQPEVALVPVPRFRYGAVAFGRLWIANTANEPGLVRPSLVGVWGSFPEELAFVPDPNGAEITGIINAPDGLLVFTRNSTFKIQQDEIATNYVVSTVSNSVGCASQGTIQTLADQTVVWLGDTGFYAYAPGKGLVKISEEIDYYVSRILFAGIHLACSVYDSTRNEYVCFVPYKLTDKPRMGFVLSKDGWRFYDPVSALPDDSGTNKSLNSLAWVRSVCETKDPRRLILGALTMNGIQVIGNKNDLYVLNRFRGIPLYTNLTTSWINAGLLGESGLQTIYLLLRETYYSEEQPPMKTISAINAPIKLQVYRDFEEDEPEIGYSAALDYQKLNNFWSQTEFPINLRRGRLFWARIDVNLPAADAFKVVLTSTQFMEFMGMSFNTIPTDPSLSTLPIIRPNKLG